MNVAMMQPGFMPWLGLFELIYKSDIFIFLDDFQFSVQSYDQRNRIFVNKGQIGWYTAPVQKNISFKEPLNQTKLKEDMPWRKKMWNRIKYNYSKAPFFDSAAPSIKQWLFTIENSLAEQNISFIKLVCDLLRFKCMFRYSSDYYTVSYRSQRVLELLKWCNASNYYCSKGSFGYMAEDDIFPVKGIEVFFQNFIPLAYDQVGSIDQFAPFLSVTDALMNVGPEGTLYLIKNGTKKWLTWDDCERDNNNSDN